MVHALRPGLPQGSRTGCRAWADQAHYFMAVGIVEWPANISCREATAPKIECRGAGNLQSFLSFRSHLRLSPAGSGVGTPGPDAPGRTPPQTLTGADWADLRPPASIDLFVVKDT